LVVIVSSEGSAVASAIFPRVPYLCRRVRIQQLSLHPRRIPIFEVGGALSC
jgi:hypothetical protein